MIAFCRNGNTLLKYVSVYHCFKHFAVGAQGGKEGGEVLVQEKHSSVHVYYAQVYKAIKYFFLFFSQDDCISFIFLEPIDPNSLYLTLSKFYSLTSLWPLKWIIFFFKITNSSFHLLETMLLNRSSCLATMGKIVLWLSLFTPSQNNFIFQTQRVSEKFREITKKGPYFPSSLWYWVCEIILHSL